MSHNAGDEAYSPRVHPPLGPWPRLVVLLVVGALVVLTACIDDVAFLVDAAPTFTHP